MIKKNRTRRKTTSSDSDSQNPRHNQQHGQPTQHHHQKPMVSRWAGRLKGFVTMRSALLLAVPLTFLFDLIVLLWTQHGCLHPQCISVFVQSSSLTYSIVQGVIPVRK